MLSVCGGSSKKIIHHVVGYFAFFGVGLYELHADLSHGRKGRQEEEKQFKLWMEAGTKFQKLLHLHVCKHVNLATLKMTMKYFYIILKQLKQ